MHPEVIGHMATQHGLVTRRQALAAGLPLEYVARLVRSGRWVSVRRGVYAEADLWESLDPRSARPLLTCRAASLATRKPHLASHDYAALALGMPFLRPETPMVHFTRPGVVGSRTEHGVKHHKAPYRPDQVVRIDGRGVLDHARTAADLAREHGLLAGVVAFDAALEAGATFADLDGAIAPMRNWPHVTVVRESRRLSRRGAQSLGETLMRIMVEELGIGPPQTQFTLRDAGREAACDLRVGRHVFEFDGEIKLIGIADGGVATRPAHEVLWEEKKRQDWVCGFKLGMSRIVWSDCFGLARERAQARMLREFRDTCARFGTDIGDLAPYVVTPRHLRPRDAA